MRVAGCDASRLGFRLLQAGRHAFGYSEASVNPLGSLVSSLVALYFHVAGYPVESDSSPSCGQALQGAQDGGDEDHVVLGVQLLKGVQPRPGVSVYDDSDLPAVVCVLQGL